MKKELKRRFLSNSDTKVLLENFISLSTLQLVTSILPLVTLPYILRIFEFETYGIIVLATVFVAYFKSITDYSFRITATRDTSIFRNNTQKLSVIYSKVMIIKAIFLLGSISVIGIIVYFYPPFYKEKDIFFITTSSLVGYALFPEWFFQGIERMKYITIINVLIKLLFTLSVFLFIRSSKDYWIYPLLQSIGLFITGLVGQYILLRKFKIRFIPINKRSIFYTIKKNFAIFINQIFPLLYNNTSTFLLGILATTDIVGIYDAIKKIIDFAKTFLNIFSRVFFPYLMNRKNEFVKYKKLIFIVTIIIIALILLLNRIIFWYLNLSGSSILPILFILDIGILGYVLYDVYGLNYFIVRNQDTVVMRNTIYTSLIGLLTAFPLIFYFGIFGAAINLTLTRFLMGGGLYLKWVKHERTTIVSIDDKS